MLHNDTLSFITTKNFSKRVIKSTKRREKENNYSGIINNIILVNTEEYEKMLTIEVDTTETLKNIMNIKL